MTDFTGGAWRSLIDGQEVGAIPDTGLDHFYWSQELSGVDPWTDEAGNKDLSSTGNPTLQNGINSNQTVAYDGDDSHSSSTAASLGTNNVYTFAGVFQLSDTNVDYSIYLNGKEANSGFELRTESGIWKVFHHTVASYSGVSIDTNPHVIVGTYDGSNVIVDLDGSNIINTSASAPLSPSGAVEIARGSSNNLVGDVGAFGFEPAAADANRRDELTKKLAEPFGISVSI